MAKWVTLLWSVSARGVRVKWQPLFVAVKLVVVKYLDEQDRSIVKRIVEGSVGPLWINCLALYLFCKVAEWRQSCDRMITSVGD